MNRKRLFLLNSYTLLLLLIGAVLAVLVGLLWSGNTRILPGFLEPLREMGTEDVVKVTLVSLAATVCLGIIGYLISLGARQDKRPLLAIYLIGVGMLLPAAGMAGGIGADTSPILAAAQFAAVAFIPPFLIFLFEWIAGGLGKGIGHSLEKMDQPGAAGRFLGMARLFRPSDPDLLRRHALAEYMAGNFSRAIPIMERLRTVGEHDRTLLENLETSYRHERLWEKDIEVLHELLAERPKEIKSLRLLAQAHERLEQWQPALEAREASTDFRNPAQMEDVARLALRANKPARALHFARALRDVEGKPYKRTLEIYADILAANPRMIEAMEEMAEIHLRLDHEPKAVAVWEKVLELDPSRIEPRRRLIQYFQGLGQLETEETHLLALTRNDRKDAEALLRLAANLDDQQRSEESRSVLADGIERFPADYRFAYEYSRQSLAAGQIESAEAALSRAEVAAGKSEASRMGALRRRIQTEKNNRELHGLRELIQKNPGDPEPRLRLVERLTQMSDWASVRIEFDHLLTARPDLRADVIQRLKDLIARTDQNYLLQDYLADLLFIDRRFDEVLELYEQMSSRSIHKEQTLIEHCRKILRAAPDFAPALSRLGTLLTQTGQWEKAIEMNARYIQMTEAYDPAKVRELFQAHLALGQVTEAEGYAQSLLAEDSQNIDLRMKLIDGFEEHRQFEDAIRLIREVTEISPANPAYQRRLDLLIRKRKRQRIDELESELAANGESSELHFEKGDLHEQFQEYDHAIAHFQKAARGSELQNLATARLGHCLALRGMFDLASETLSQVQLSANESQQDELKSLLYDSGLLFEEEGLGQRALDVYKAIFRADASFRDIVSRLSRYRA